MSVNNFLGGSNKKKEKTQIILLGVLSLAILVFGVMQMRNNIRSPFQLGDEYADLSKSDNTNNIGTCNGPDCLSEAELKEKDTDGDGLSDWEETNIYNTSPYLADTDSDGVSDYNEIQKGDDPNCPEGSDCNYIEESEDSYVDNNFDNTNLEEDLSSIEGILDSANNGNLEYSGDNISVPEDEERLKEALSGSMNIEDLRSLLIESGMDEKTVKSFSDEELKNLYQETLTGMSQNLNK